MVCRVGLATVTKSVADFEAPAAQSLLVAAEDSEASAVPAESAVPLGLPAPVAFHATV